MKKALLPALTLLACLLTVSCGGEAGTPVQTDAAPSTAPQTETAAPETEAPVKEKAPLDWSLYSAPAPETVEPDTADIKGISIIGARTLAQKGKAVIVGTCDPGVTIKAETADGGVYESKSYYGYFSVLVDSGKKVDVTLTQYYDGTQIGESVSGQYNAKAPGKDMWGIVGGNDFQFYLEKELPDYLGENLLSDAELNALKETVSGRVEKVKDVSENGCEIIYLIAPSAMTVYADRVPAEYQRAEYTRLDQVSEALTEAGATVIDLRSTFAEHKDDQIPIFYRNDSHWTEYGGYLAYVKLFDYISGKFQYTAPHPYSDFTWTPDYYISGDVTYYLEYPQEKILEYEWLRTPNYRLPANVAKIKRYKTDTTLAYAGYSAEVSNDILIDNDDEDMPSLYIFRDSFSAQLYDIVSEQTDKCHWKPMWSYSWNIADIKRDKPDYVVYIIAEWTIGEILK